MSAVAIIPARGGSRRIEHKNRKLFHGKPIIAYSIEAAKASELFKQVIVSTDDGEIGTIAQSCGAVFLRRDQKLCEDLIGTQEVTAHVLRQITDPRYGMARFDYACCIYATAPMMTAEDLKRGFDLLIEGGYEFTRPVAREIINGKEMWVDPGQWYWGATEAFLNGTPLVMLAGHIGIVCIPEERACDINTPENWSRAEAMYAALHKVPA